MAGAGEGEPLSLHEQLARRRRGAFVGRHAEMAAFTGNLGTDPADPAHTFLFHVHGPGGVGKTTLLDRWERAARERGALTATVDEAAMTVPAAMDAVCARLAAQGRPLKATGKLLALHRQLRQEAESVAAGDAGPSVAGTLAAHAGLAGLGLLPGMGALAGAMDPAQVAQGVDRLRGLLGARFRDERELRLVLDPVAVLSPVFTADLAAAAAHAPWLTLFFDTYERTGPVLDRWVRDLFVEGRHGALPATVVVTLAGQRAPDPAVWADHLDLVAELPLAPFTEDESRQLLAARGVTDEAVVAAVLRLTDGLPVLVGALAASRPGHPDAVGDPADTAVERFLAWEPDPDGRAAVLAAALPLELDEDVFRTAVAADAPQAAGRYDWLRGLPFVTEHGGRARYHDVVRAQMLRLRRTRSPQRWREQHERLAAAYGAWRAREERGRGVGELWADEAWRTQRLHETYHCLCADPRAALPDALLDLARACTAGPETARRWIRVLTDAAEDTAAPALARWAAALGEVYAEAYGPGPAGGTDAAAAGAGLAARALTVILERGGLDRERRAAVHAVRAWARRQAGRPHEALADYDRAEELGMRGFLLHAGRGDTRWTVGDPAGAVPDYAAALAAEPGHPRAPYVRTQLGGALMRTGRAAEALAELDAAVEADPAGTLAREYRATVLLNLHRPADALADAEACLADAAAPDIGHVILRAVANLELGHRELAAADLDALLADPAAVRQWADELGPYVPVPRTVDPAPREH
ncbi:tetratricopeptide repeat protein [Streptomyces sp. NRRL F-5123]|uniref:tetratricopeptide repeat protein n=1 Tax=Streptomyces sp. NRRL F-5123 TaxID=1463856 RepID=UPI0006950025|nr:tetratricopeptide repeat protein [Streptomyces sp. NRRL F-5123]